MAAPAPAREHFAHFVTIATRWSDNDQYGHINNVVYYSYFDTAVNHHLIDAGVLDPASSPVIGVVVDTQCSFRQPLSFPDQLDIGLRVSKLGTRSVTYQLGVFRAGAPEPAAFGRFVHVYVERVQFTPVAIPAPVRRALEPLYQAP
ncbi:MAG: thioesterase family protein [Myxococcota bacterium]